MSARRFIETGRKIVAVGRNYAEHAKELGNAIPTKPLLFLKPTSSYLRTGGAIEVPADCSELHHEVELGVVIGKTCKRINKADADQYIAGYTLALDMTARNLQDEAKKKGFPWSVAKGYDTFCPISEFIEKGAIKDVNNVRLWCSVDTQIKQDGNTKDMIFKVPEIIEYISGIFTLEEGDVILTGTPSGVGPVRPGQVIEAGLDDITRIQYVVVQRT